MPARQGAETSYADSTYYDKYSLKPYNPDSLYQKNSGYAIHDQMREDDQISSVLGLKKLITLNADYDIECEDDDVRNFLFDCFDKYIDGTFRSKLYEILSCMDYGFSITEKIASVIETKDGNRIVFNKLKTRAPHTFEIHTDDFGNTTEIMQHTGKKGDISLDPKKFILYSYNSEFDNPYGKTLFNKGVYRAWWSKDAIIKFWNMYLERFGMPLTVGTIPKSASTEDKDRFKTALGSIQSRTALTVPEGFLVDLKKASETPGEFEKAIDKYNTMMARSMLVPDLLGFSGSETGGGSFALGKEQFNIFYTGIEYDRQNLANIIQRELVNPLVSWNFGSKVEAYFCWKQVDSDKKLNDMKLWIEAVKTGKVPVKGDHVNWFLSGVGAPEIDQDELDIIDDQKDAMRENLSGVVGANNAQAQPEGEAQDKTQETIEENKEQIQEKEEPEKSDDSQAEKQMCECGHEHTYQEINDISLDSLSQYEKKADFSKIIKETDNIEAKYKELLGNIFKTSINALVDEIRTRKIIEKKRIDSINKLNLKYQPQIKKIVKDMMSESVVLGETTAPIPNKYKKYDLVDVTSQLNDDDIATWIDNYAFYVSDMEAGFILGKVKPILMSAIQKGLGTAETVKLINDALIGYDIKTTETGGSARIDIIVRTNVNKAYNQALVKDFARIQEYIQAYQISAIMDKRTSATCQALNHKIIKANQLSYYTPPFHFRCRTTLVPIFIDEEPVDWNSPEAQLPATDQAEGGFLELK